MERKVLPFEVKVDSEGPGEFEGFANVVGIVDEGGDKVMPGAFAPVLDAFLKEGFISWNHDWGNPVAYPTEAMEEPVGLRIKAAFHSTDQAQQVRRIVQERASAGRSVGLSIGYEIDDAKYNAGVREINSFERLFEVGLVMVPMNRPSTVTAVKGSLGSELPYGDRLALGLAQAEELAGEIRSLADHTRNRADLRQKDGRVLSAVNRARLATLQESLSAVLTDITELLDTTDPDRDKKIDAIVFRSMALLQGI